MGTEPGIVVVLLREEDGTVYVDSAWHESTAAMDRLSAIQKDCKILEAVPELVAVGMPFDAPYRREVFEGRRR